MHPRRFIVKLRSIWYQDETKTTYKPQDGLPMKPIFTSVIKWLLIIWKYKLDKSERQKWSDKHCRENWPWRHLKWLRIELCFQQLPSLQNVRRRRRRVILFSDEKIKTMKADNHFMEQAYRLFEWVGEWCLYLIIWENR